MNYQIEIKKLLIDFIQWIDKTNKDPIFDIFIEYVFYTQNISKFKQIKDLLNENSFNVLFIKTAKFLNEKLGGK